MLCGCAQETASEKAALFAEAADVLVAAGADLSTAAKAYFVPGRVEVMGKHTDYAGGRSLLAAISKAFCVVTVACYLQQTCGPRARLRACEIHELRHSLPRGRWRL